MSIIQRTKGVPHRIGAFYDWVSKGSNPTGFFETVDEWDQHYFLRSQTNPFRDGAYRDGGWFLSMKIRRGRTPSANVTTFREGWAKAYVGQYVCNPPPNWGPGTSWGTLGGANAYKASLEARGAEAWARMRPDKPDFTFASSLYELKDVPGMLKGGLSSLMDMMDHARPGGSGRSSRSPISRTAQYYLALKFGWLPLLSDIRNFVKAQRSKQKRLDQLIRDAGRSVHRKCSLNDSNNIGRVPNSDVFTPIPNGYGAGYYPTHVTQCYTGTGYRKQWWTQTARTWGEGSFRYFLPPGPKTVAWKAKMLRRIMGQRVTPSMVYNVIPWSWLVDYFTSLGDFIDATSSGVSDRLVADYAYLMREEHYRSDEEKQGMSYSDVKMLSAPNVIMMSAWSDTCTKGRVRASPFGWGINQNSLSSTQLAILGALGLSRLP